MPAGLHGSSGPVYTPFNLKCFKTSHSTGEIQIKTTTKCRNHEKRYRKKKIKNYGLFDLCACSFHRYCASLFSFLLSLLWLLFCFIKEFFSSISLHLIVTLIGNPSSYRDTFTADELRPHHTKRYHIIYHILTLNFNSIWAVFAAASVGASVRTIALVGAHSLSPYCQAICLIVYIFFIFWLSSLAPLEYKYWGKRTINTFNQRHRFSIDTWIKQHLYIIVRRLHRKVSIKATLTRSIYCVCARECVFRIQCLCVINTPTAVDNCFHRNFTWKLLFLYTVFPPNECLNPKDLLWIIKRSNKQLLNVQRTFDDRRSHTHKNFDWNQHINSMKSFSKNFWKVLKATCER